MPPFPESPRCLSPLHGNLFSLHCLHFQAEDRLTPRWHVGQPCGKASWKSLEGMPQIPFSSRREALQCCYSSGGKCTCMPPLGTRTDSPGDSPEYTKIHVSTGEESSSSGTHSTQDLKPRHRREKNPERPPSNSHRDWPFLRPPELVPDVPVVKREHLPQLESIEEVLPSRRDEAHSAQAS